MTDAALSLGPTLPDPPQAVLQLLNSYGVPYQIRYSHGQVSAAQRIQAVMLEDHLGALMVLYAHDQLLDLTRLSELTGRQLSAIKPERLEQLLGKNSLHNLPALPPLANSPVLYDQRLKEQPRLLIESGREGVWLDVNTQAFSVMLDQASAARFGQAVSSIKPNLDRASADQAEINHAVQAFTARRIQQRLKQTIEIPPLPETALKIIKLRVNKDATVDDITGIVETDPALAAQVISWAASPYYAAPGKIRSVEDAIVRILGFDLVINLALGLALGKTLSLPKDQAHLRTPYWQQAIYTAAVIEGLCRAMPREQRPEPGLVYLAGLLHNFGYLVLAHVFPPHFSLACRHLEINPHLDPSYIEQHLLGITREQIGAWLMRLWDMPEELTIALRFQKDPNYQGPSAVYANLVYLAVNLLRNRGIGAGPQQIIPDTLYQRLGLEPAKAEAVLDKIQHAEAALRELASQFNHPADS